MFWTSAKSFVERRRFLGCLGVGIVFFWAPPGPIHDHAGADAAHALILGIERQPAHLFCRSRRAFAVNLLDFGKELHQSLAIIRATASVRRWRAVELLEFPDEGVASGHSDLALLVNSGPQPKYSKYPHISSNPTARTLRSGRARACAQVRVSSRHLQGRLELRVASLLPAFCGGVEAVADQVETDAGDVLRDEFDRRNALPEIAFQCDVEARILGTGTVIGEVERLLDQTVEIDAATFAAAAP